MDTPSHPRCAAIIGPFGTGKSTLANALQNLGDSPAGNADAASLPHGARRYLQCDYLGDRWSFIDCPGAIENLQHSIDAIAMSDVAIFVAEAKQGTEVTSMPLLRAIAEAGIPAILFINKVDQLEGTVTELVESFSQICARPLLLRQLPIVEGEAMTGAVDLISRRGFRYREGQPSEVVEVPHSLRDEVEVARERLLESLADFDDALLERLLEDDEPTTDEVFRTGGESFSSGRYFSVLVGSAEHGNGLVRLFKSIRHDVRGVEAGIARHEFGDGDGLLATVGETRSLQHVGRTSVVRLWRGSIDASTTVGGQRFAGLAFYDGATTSKVDRADAGDLVALTRCEELQTGTIVNESGTLEQTPAGWHPLTPVYALSFHVTKREDDAKLSTTLRRVVEDDASLSIGDASEGGITVLGQGDMHLRDLAQRLEQDYSLQVTTEPVTVAWRETLTKPTDIHARHKKQTGGAGQFADVKVRFAPTPRGSGFSFESVVVGGSVPRGYIPAVEAGIQLAMERGPLGFPVVDVAATLYDGQHHSVDSSEMAFKMAGRKAMADAMEQGKTALLEPIHLVVFETPSQFTSKVNAIITGRRGRILGFEALAEHPGWDELSAHLPEVALSDIILELRAATQGVARYQHEYDHYQEVYGKEAETVVAKRQQELAKR